MDLSFPILTTAVLLFFILDPFGNVPLLLSILKHVDKPRRRFIIIREMFIGLAILLTFLFFGEQFLSLFHLETQSITIAGGIIFFIISLKMIFPDANSENMFATKNNSDPLIVPIAMPMIAGPAALATLLVLAKTNQEHSMELLVALLLAWVACFLVMFFSTYLYKVLKVKGLIALERLMGMLLLMLSVQMFIDGIRALIPTFM